MEIQRIMDHMICCGTNIVDIGALTNFWYFYNARDKLNDVLEALTGARLTYSYTRSVVSRGSPRISQTGEGGAGGTEGHTGRDRFDQEPHLPGPPRGVGNRREKALSFGWTGPCLRAMGYPMDLRR
jgi:NADH:ubiquinone oxidoreductase subunit D